MSKIKVCTNIITKTGIRLLFVFVALISLPSHTQEITLAYESLPPHIYKGNDGEAQGPVADLFRHYLSPVMNIKVNLVYMPLSRAFQSMKFDIIDGIAIVGFNKERSRKYCYSEYSLHDMRSVFTIRKDYVLNMLNLEEELKGTPIGYFQDGILTAYMEKNKFELSKIAGENVWGRNVERLLKGRIDVIYSPSKMNMLATIKNNTAENKVRIIDIPEEPVKLHTLLTSAECTKSMIVKKYNQAFKKIDAGKIYNDLLTESLAFTAIKK